MADKLGALPAGEEPTPEQAIAARRRRLLDRSDILAFLAKLCAAALAAWLALTLVFGLAVMEGEGMYPRIRDGDLLLFYRLEQSYTTGDVVTFTRDGRRYVGRIVARGGDVVELNDSGELLVNGNVQTEQIFYPTTPQGSEVGYPCRVDDESVFLLCDFRTNATDSRTYGSVPLGELEGKVVTILRRRGI